MDRISEVFNMDCMVGMAQYPDKYFDLAVVDPPYGIGMGIGAGETRGSGKKKEDLYIPKKWDTNKPLIEYWNGLFRVSKNQVIWGGNYFTSFLYESRGWIYWRKLMGGSYSDGELAWTSFDCTLKEYTKRSEQGFTRIHPTQKPISLYGWIYKNYLPEGGKVIDTHLGSGSNRIAAVKAGNIDFTGYELDKDYFEAQEKRFKDFKSQTVMEFV